MGYDLVFLDLVYTRTTCLQGPVVISRDHHDVSGTDSPYRETSNIYDGSAFCAGRSREQLPILIAEHFYLADLLK